MAFLLDTDICSVHLKNPTVLTTRFLQYNGRLHVSTISVGELFTWVLRAKASAHRLNSLLDLLDDLTILDVNLAVARQFGETRAKLLDWLAA